jgi:hypothetical protein
MKKLIVRHVRDLRFHSKRTMFLAALAFAVAMVDLALILMR